jgi:hypothetical protein
MPELLMVSLAAVLGVVLWLVCATLCNPRPMATLLEWLTELRERRRGPRPSGPPIEQIAADLRRLMREHDRLVRPPPEWHRAHHLRACELALHDRAEEAATALGLPAYADPAGGGTTEELAWRLRQLAQAGLVLTEIAGLGGDRM